MVSSPPPPGGHNRNGLPHGAAKATEATALAFFLGQPALREATE